MIKAECDRCGKQEVTPEVSGRVTLGLRVETPLPADWRELALRDPISDEVMPRRWQLCEECVNAFLSGFLEGDGAVPGLLEAATLDALCTCPQPQEPRPPCALHEPVDPRPNLTERARLIATGQRCVCAGAGFGTEDCPMHHPQGLAEGTHLECRYGAEGDECPGIFRRGLFTEHMERWHGIPVSRESEPCPFCPTIERGSKLGAHIAKDHPGQWQAWVDEENQRNRRGGA